MNEDDRMSLEKGGNGGVSFVDLGTEMVPEIKFQVGKGTQWLLLCL